MKAFSNFSQRQRAWRRRILGGLTLGVAIATNAVLFAPQAVQAETLVINSDRSNPRQKATLAKIASDFEARNPGVTVTINTSDIESHKTAIRNYLVTSPPDVAFWYTGTRMRAFTKRNLFEDLSSFYQANGLTEPMKPFIPAVTDNGKQYMMPTTFSTWGFFYKKDIFEKHGITPPKTWGELMAVAAKLKENGIVPFTIGTRDLWANDLWFDYLDLGINGLDFHMQLMDGKVPYTDPRVKEVFAHWREPIEKGYFLENHTSYGWQEAIPFLAQGKAAMYLLGTGVLTSLPVEAHKEFGFFPFPEVKPNMPRYEEVSINGIFVPAGAKNKELGMKFLAFLGQPDNLKAFAEAGASLPARTDVELGDNPFAQTQMTLVKQAKGSSQFYDRDTDPDMAQVGMKGFQEFTVNPSRVDQILDRLEATRQRIFK